ncbi:MAG: histidinol-phosphate aminotransferase [Pseudonocardiales bacterium]|jgi:histidinol-phosphate aminotransferase|nr:histidinol-phosphate aminotransferase [Pseudonocardiales bacterium]
MTALDELLAHHGDRDAGPGLVDLAVNVRPGTPPQWLRRRLAAVDLARYPDTSAATRALGSRHGRPPAEVLLTSGAAEAFTLIARARRPRHAVVVHPQFTEPEVALRAAGHDVQRVVLREPFVLDPAAIPEDADLVVIGNPTNPTSVLHPAETLRALSRPGRVLVLDEAFADAVPGEPHSLAGTGDVPGLLVVRSLTKTWGLAGLRVGYVLGAAGAIADLAAAQPHWAVSSLAAEACLACTEPPALAEAATWARGLTADRAHLADLLADLPGVRVVPNAAAPFLLVHTPTRELWTPLRERGFAVRRGDTFPGLGTGWIRVAVRDRATSTVFATTLAGLL